jgi:hypothetical protein
MKMKVTTANRITSIFLTTSGILLFFIAFFILANFLIDRDNILNTNLPQMSKNQFIDICDTISCKKGHYTQVIAKILFNILLVCLFWFQHIVMANNRFKVFLTNISNYPTYERGLYVLRNHSLLNVYK